MAKSGFFLSRSEGLKDEVRKGVVEAGANRGLHLGNVLRERSDHRDTGVVLVEFSSFLNIWIIGDCFVGHLGFLPAVDSGSVSSARRSQPPLFLHSLLSL